MQIYTRLDPLKPVKIRTEQGIVSAFLWEHRKSEKELNSWSLCISRCVSQNSAAEERVDVTRRQCGGSPSPFANQHIRSRFIFWSNDTHRTRRREHSRWLKDRKRQIFKCLLLVRQHRTTCMSSKLQFFLQCSLFYHSKGAIYLMYLMMFIFLPGYILYFLLYHKKNLKLSPVGDSILL